MKNKLKYSLITTLLIVVIYTNRLHSQTFVDDIERVEIVVIDYCIDEKGERYNIKINKEKTTYSDEGWQQGCIENFKNARLMYPMKMVNDCWDSIYYFVNSKYKTFQLPESDRVKCKVFHKGNFKYENLALSNTKIIRRKNRQIEKSPDRDQRQVYKINWIENHIYTLKTLKLPLEKDKHKIGNLIYVEIIELLDENTYLYKAYIKDNDDDNVIYGIIKKVS